ncbi:MAG: 7-cyano-7-deazaguanine synthase [Pirellulales bacterium]
MTEYGVSLRDLLAALGASTAIMLGERVIEMFESGVGAINLPLMSGMGGPRTTKSCHPHFLRLMSRLASLIAEDNVEFRLPFFDHTKGEVVKKLASLKLHDLAALTGSCVGFPLRHSDAKHCGVCPACLFRRQAMHVGGIAEAGRSYKYDIFDWSHLNSNRSERLKYLKAFLMQVAQLDGAEPRDRLPGPFERHALSTDILRRGQSQKGLIDLLVRYRDEWTTITSEARRSNLSWATWLAPRAKEQHAQGAIHASA